jgi:hypothetical protein
MDLKTKKKISLFGILAYFLILCAASVYVYFQVGKGKEVFFVSFITIFSMMIVPLYYFGTGKKEVKQKHKILQILIMAIGWLILLFWQISYTPLFLVTDPATAFLWIWESSAICFFVGLMLAIGIHHTDEIAEKFKRKKTDDSEQKE